MEKEEYRRKRRRRRRVHVITSQRKRMACILSLLLVNKGSIPLVFKSYRLYEY